MSFYSFMPKLFNMSLTASVAIVLVILLRLLLKKAPKVISYVLWVVVLFRLLCPVSIGSSFSLYNLFDAPTEESGPVTSVIEYVPSNIVHTEYPSVALPVPGISDVINEALPQGEEQLRADPLEGPIFIATYVWMAGVLAMALYSIVSYIRLRRKLSVVVPLRDNIFIADDIKSPFVVGLFRPKIYLPCNLGDKEQEYIILHEQHHIKRLDHVIKALAFLALAIHWFNPLVWVAFVLASKDMEMSCDEAVIRKVGGEVRADYSASLLTLATGRRIIAGTPLAFGEGDTKGRINNLSKWKKPAVWVVLIAVVAGVVLAVCLLTNPSDDNHAPEPFSHSYRVKTIMYQDTRYSFGYTMDTAPRYQLTSDYQLFVSGDAFDGSDAGEWVQHHGAFEEIKLSGLRFDDYFKDPGNLSGWEGARYGAESIREQTKQAWRLEVDDIENGVFYYLILTHTDKVFLCYGYNVDDTYAAAEEDSLIRWVFELERTDLLTCNALSEKLDSFVELAYFPDTDIDRDTNHWPVAYINESGVLQFSLEGDADTLVVSEDYYRKSEDSTFIERNTFEITRNDDGFFTIDISRRESLEDHVNYFIKIKGQSDVYVMKVVFDEANLNPSIGGMSEPAQLGGSQKLSLNDVIMLSQKGYDLTWSDFEQFEYIETGSGLYIRVYEINEMYELWIGGGWTDEDPMYIYLALANDLDTRIDIRDGGVTKFISEYGNLAPAYHPEGSLHLGLNAEIVEMDTSNHILYVKDIDESADVFGDRCAIDSNYAISRFNLLYVNYGDANDVRTIGFSDFQVGDAIIIGLYDSEKQKALNGAAVAEQIQLGTQRLSSIRALSQNEIEQVNAAFAPIVYDKQGNPIGTNVWSCFFTSYYSDVRDMNFAEFLAYFPGDGSTVDEEEFAVLKEHPDFLFYGEVSTLANMPVPVHRYPVRIIDLVLKEYAGITVDELDTSGVVYLAEYDAFYNHTSDAGGGMFYCTRGEIDGDIVRLYEEFDYGTDVLTLKKVGNNYQIVAHQQVEG